MAVIVRFVNKKGQVIEKFLGVEHVSDTSASSLKAALEGSSCKRRDELLQNHHAKIVEKLEKGEIFSGRGKQQETTLARPGDTRWCSHHITLDRLLSIWDSVLEILQYVCDDGDIVEQRGRTSSLIEKMKSFEFVFILHLMIRVLE
ncbi:hypothetical protein Sango_0635000 [Sesamum angolense]|uniref:DUF4371 domain-containing protein n=1 Tax=Sesamum angolense TaxID=2727404 RepID=A0AAE1X6N9_9LAMI|nr:hypothetical protein Sango_0635000 [Sesamum angolense]